MPSGKIVPFVLSLIGGMIIAGSFVLAHGGLKTFCSVAEKVSWLHHWYGLLLIVVVFWIGFVGTWAAYSLLLRGVSRYFAEAGNKNVD